MGKEEARRQGSAKARGGRARRTRWARREVDGRAWRGSACILVLSVSKGCEASGETRPNAMPLIEP